jgi:hypothetical protein
MSAFQEFKLVIVSATGLSKDALHIYVGLFVFLAVVSVLRRPIHSSGPWLSVLCVAFALEFMDMRDDLSSLGKWRWAASVHDIVNTMVWPTVLLLLSRFGMLGRRSGAQPTVQPDGPASGGPTG